VGEGSNPFIAFTFMINKKELLKFYKLELYDSDLKLYLSNELIGLFMINKYYPELQFNEGYDYTGIHWTIYIIELIKINLPRVYKNVNKKLNINSNRLKNDSLNLEEQRILITSSMRLLDDYDKKILGKNLANLTKYLIEKRKSQIEMLQNEIKNG
jgi:hypothetical protein